MTTLDASFFNDFKKKKVLVIGELIVDVYLKGTCNRIAPEASVPVIDISEKRYCLGGAANVAANVVALGADVTFMSVCGSDEYGELAFDLLRKAGIVPENVIRSANRKTLYKTRVSSASQLLLRYDEGSTEAVDEDVAAALTGRMTALFNDMDAIIIADYGKGILVNPLIDVLANLHRDTEKIIALDAKNYDLYSQLHPTLVKPNYLEACALTAEPGKITDRSRLVQKWGKKLYGKTGAGYTLLTLDEDGVCAFERGAFLFYVGVPRVQYPQASGAGDTFLAAATVALASGADIRMAVKVAVAAAHQVVASPDTGVCSLRQLRENFEPHHKLIDGAGNLNAVLARLRKENRKVVFTNGCFDILHSGHVSYLKGAKALGDVLIVGLNTDDSIRRLKGSLRPINGLNDRVEVLSELACIDYIIPFGQPGDDTPVNLVKKVKPKVFVKGGDYRDKFLPEEEVLNKIGCEIVFLPMVANKSTTNVIRRINENGTLPASAAVN